MANETLLAFDSRVNYMKRSSISGQESIPLGAVGATTTTAKPITHNLGYIPVVHVSFEPTGDGTIFPTEKINKYTESSAGFQVITDPFLTYWFDTTTLTIELSNFTSPAATGSRMVYWVIYLDYGNA